MSYTAKGTNKVQSPRTIMNGKCVSPLHLSSEINVPTELPGLDKLLRFQLPEIDPAGKPWCIEFHLMVPGFLSPVDKSGYLPFSQPGKGPKIPNNSSA